VSGRGFLVALELGHRKCVVVGTSDDAKRRAEALSAHGAVVVRLLDRVDDADIADAWLVVLADRNPQLAARLSAFCAMNRILFCAVDQPGGSSFHHVAVARAGVVSVGVGTDGRAPALARRLREELERVFQSSGLAEFAERLASERESTPSAERKERQSRAVAGLRLTGKLELPDPESE
jgi:siroheme synthase (precorrin-2 oxidase/ferrochelatase)